MAHLIAPAPAGGAESVVIALAAAARDRTRVIVLNQLAGANDPPHPVSEQLRRRGVAQEELRCGRRRYVTEVRRLAAILKTHHIDVLHTHGYHACVVGYFAARRAGIPVVATVHGYLSRNRKERFYNVVDRAMMRRFDMVIAVSQAIADQLVAGGMRRERVVVVQNGLTPPQQPLDRRAARERLGLPPGTPLVGWVGRLSPEKGADLLLEALRSEASVHAVIVGDGQEEERLAQMARALGVGARVTFAGFRTDAAELLPAFDVLALSSRTEGTPMVVLEAVAAGVPIVTFAVGGIPDLLDDSSAWLVPPLDTGALGKALREAMASPEERASRARAAQRRLADRLSPERWLERIAKVYDRASGAAAG